MVDKVIFVDTNVLLTATESERALHSRARRVFDDLPNQGTRLCVSGQILREYLVVATRSRLQNGLGLTLPDALANAREFRSRCRLLEENRAVADALQSLLHAVPCFGKQLHDANVVATAVTYGVGELLTENIDDFLRFHSSISILNLRDLKP